MFDFVFFVVVVAVVLCFVFRSSSRDALSSQV